MSSSKFNRYCLYNILINNKILAFRYTTKFPSQAYFIDRDDVSKYNSYYCNFDIVLEGPNNLILLNGNLEEATLTSEPPVNNSKISSASFRPLDELASDTYILRHNIYYGCLENYINGNQSSCSIGQLFHPTLTLGYDINSFEGDGKYRAIFKTISTDNEFRDEEFIKYFNVSIREKCSKIDSLYNECKDDKDMGVDFAYPFIHIPPSAGFATEIDTFLPCALLGVALAVWGS